MSLASVVVWLLFTTNCVVLIAGTSAFNAYPLMDQIEGSMSFSGLFTTLVAINFVLGCSTGPEEEAIQTVSSTLISISTEYDRATPRLGEEPASPDLGELYRDKRVLGIIRAGTQFLIEWPQERRVVIYENEDGIPTVAIHDDTSPQLIASFALPNDAETRVWGFTITSTLGWDSQQTLPTFRYYAEDTDWTTSYAIRLSDQVLSFASIRKSDQRVFRSGPVGEYILGPPIRGYTDYDLIELWTGHHQRGSRVDGRMDFEIFYQTDPALISSDQCSDWIPNGAMGYIESIHDSFERPGDPVQGFRVVEAYPDRDNIRIFLLEYYFMGVNGGTGRAQVIEVLSDERERCWRQDRVMVGGSFMGSVLDFEIRNGDRLIFSTTNNLPSDTHVGGATGYGSVVYHVENGTLRID